MIFGDSILKYKEDIIYHIGELVKIKSVQSPAQPGCPFGSEVDKALEYMLELGKSLGFETKNIDGYAGHVEYGKGSGIAAVLVHLDVVPAGDGWTWPPYEATLSEGKIYGRGTADNKGPAVAALFSLKALKDSGIVPDKRIRIIFGTNEESGMGDMEYYFSKEPLPDLGFSPDAGYPIYNREKGIMRISLKADSDRKGLLLSVQGGNAANIVPENCTGKILLKDLTKTQLMSLKKLAFDYEGCDIKIETGADEILIRAKGKPAHASSPGSGVNAISHFVKFISLFDPDLCDSDLIKFILYKIKLETNGSGLSIDISDEESGELTLNLGIIDISPDTASATIDIRYPVTFSGKEIIEKIEKQAADYGLSLSSVSDSPPLFIKEGHPLLDILIRAYEKASGKKAELLSMGGGTYARTLKNRGVAFGSAEGGNVHQADEYISIESLMYHSRICTQAVYELAVAKIP
jgi:succinyl-diaminopimelate desuccinylase